jgi:hypothetical protein
MGEGAILPPWAGHGFIGDFEALTTLPGIFTFLLKFRFWQLMSIVYV